MIVLMWVIQELPEKLKSVTAIMKDYVFGENNIGSSSFLFNKSWALVPNYPSNLLFSHRSKLG
jgi:hypothetical protein